MDNNDCDSYASMYDNAILDRSILKSKSNFTHNGHYMSNLKNLTFYNSNPFDNSFR